MQHIYCKCASIVSFMLWGETCSHEWPQTHEYWGSDHAHFGITIECHNWKRSQGPSCTMVGVGKQGTSVGMIFWRTWAGLPEASGISFFKVNWIGNVTASFAENDLAWFHTTAEWLIELAVPRRNLNTFDLYDYVTRKCFRLWFQTFVLDLLVETAMMCHLRPVE